MNQSGSDCLCALSQRLSFSSLMIETSFLFQHISVSIQCFNSVCFYNSFGNMPIVLLSETHLELNNFCRQFLRLWEWESVTSDNLECRFLFQRLSIFVQRFNAILLHDIFYDSLFLSFLSDERRN
jgi:hypothetical protein